MCLDQPTDPNVAWPSSSCGAPSCVFWRQRRTHLCCSSTHTSPRRAQPSTNSAEWVATTRLARPPRSTADAARFSPTFGGRRDGVAGWVMAGRGVGGGGVHVGAVAGGWAGGKKGVGGRCVGGRVGWVWGRSKAGGGTCVHGLTRGGGAMRRGVCCCTLPAQALLCACVAWSGTVVRMCCLLRRYGCP